MRFPRLPTLLRLGATALLAFAVSFTLVRTSGGIDGSAWRGEGAGSPEPTASRGATVDVLLDGPDLFVDLDVPAVTLLGFAHAPSNRAEHEAMRDTHRRLDAGDLIIASPEARCTLAESFATVGHGYDDLCSATDTGEGGLPDGVIDPWSAADVPVVDGPRPDVAARWSWTCAAPERLRSLEVRLFEAFDRVERIDVTLDLDDAEGALGLVPARPIIDL